MNDEETQSTGVEINPETWAAFAEAGKKICETLQACFTVLQQIADACVPVLEAVEEFVQRFTKKLGRIWRWWYLGRAPYWVQRPRLMRARATLPYPYVRWFPARE